jgi:protein-arginine kinase activator protein McsA
VQKHVVQHVVSQEDYEDKAKKLRDKIKAKQAKQAQVEAIDGVMEV